MTTLKLWTQICLLMPINLYDATMSIWDEALGQDEDRLRNALGKLRRTYGADRSSQAALTDLVQFRRQIGEMPNTAIARFQGLVTVLDTLSREEGRPPIDRNDRSVREALVNGMGDNMITLCTSMAVARDIDRNVR